MFFPGATFADALDNFVCNFFGPDSAQDRLKLLHGIGQDDAAETLEAVAAALFSDASGLAATDISTFAETLQSVIAMGPAESGGKRIEYLLRAADARIAEDAVGLARSAQDRLPTLIALIQRTQLSEPTAAFLRHVSRCFLYGFDIECAILCRSALDTEFQAEVPTDACARILGNRPKRDGESAYDLCDRIAVAGRIQRLDPATVELAHRVRKRTNSLLHRSPQQAVDSTEILSSALEVIAALHRTSPTATTG